jgi:hypothetical protein
MFERWEGLLILVLMKREEDKHSRSEWSRALMRAWRDRWVMERRGKDGLRGRGRP